LIMPTAPQNEDSNTILPTRPHAWISTITFKDGTQLNLNRQEVVVFVGPNNAGKSAALRDLDYKLDTRVHQGLVISEIAYNTEGTEAGVAAWFDSLQKIGHVDVALSFGMMNRGSAGTRWLSAVAKAGFRDLKNLFEIHLTTEARLQAANQVSSINFSVDSPNHPLHHLFDTDGLEESLSRMFKQAFGEDLVLNRGAGSAIMLHLGAKPTAPGGDRMAKSYRDAVSALPQIQAQGDGIRAFVGVLLHTQVIAHDITIIDEPEAFLHPPQAFTIGRLLASKPRSLTEGSSQEHDIRQLIVATHSSDFLRGLLDAPGSTVRVVRIRRDGNTNSIRELAPTSVRDLWRDPLLRYSKILDGLFHDGVIVCEADGDCRFWEAVIDVVAGEMSKPDLLLVHSGGKQRVPTVVKALRAIDIPVRAVLDFDVLRDANELRTIYESLGGNWNDIETDLKIVRAAIEKKRPELSVKDVKAQIAAVLDKVGKENLPSDAAKEINAAVRRASPWAEAKRVGAAFIPNGLETQAYNRLASQLRSKGLHLVEVGELEQFCKSVPSHGPAWVLTVLAKDLKNDSELEEARKFASGLLSGWS
jgi:hypothetical protein